MKMLRLEYYDWVDREWRAVPNQPTIPEDKVTGELSRLRAKTFWGKYKTRATVDTEG